jgi:putative DNA primase/helicase
MIVTDPCPVVIMRSTGPRHSRKSIITAFPPKFGQATKKTANLRNNVPRQEVELTGAQRLIVAQTVAEMQSEHPVLWQGKFNQFGARRGGGHYESQSDADLAMAGYIAKSLADKVSTTDELMALTERVMGHSVLAQRDKWHNRAYYRQRTIEKSCAGVDVQPLVNWDLSGDVRNAKAFARMFKGKMLFVYKGGKWLNWKDNRWRICEEGEELEAAKIVATKLVKLAADELADDPDRGKRLIREATAASMLPRLNAMLELAPSEPGMGTTPEKLDAQPDLLGVANGVVNLRMGWIMPNEPSLLITQHCAASYDKSATAPLWLQTLDEVFQGDTATINALQVLLGLTLTGEAGEELIVFAYGIGANGKSVISNVVATIMGDYAKTAPPSLLASRRTDDHSARSDIAMLNGARLVSINELPGGMFLDEQVVKQLAGREPISARFLHKEFFSFLPRFTPWVRTNHKPIVRGEDDGIWRRIALLPFKRQFAPHEQDPNLEAKLLAERDGILRWMIEGAQRYYRDGLRLSKPMRREQAQYRKDSDLLGEFLDECTEVKAGERAEQTTLFGRWHSWCKSNGVQCGSKKSFTQRLAERGFAAVSSNGKRYYSGIKCIGFFDQPHSGGVQEGQD